MKNTLFQSRYFFYWIITGLTSEAVITLLEISRVWFLLVFMILSLTISFLDQRLIVNKRKLSEEEEIKLRTEFAERAKLIRNISAVVCSIGLIGTLIALIFTPNAPIGIVGYFTLLPFIIGMLGLLSYWITIRTD